MRFKRRLAAFSLFLFAFLAAPVDAQSEDAIGICN